MATQVPSDEIAEKERIITGLRSNLREHKETIEEQGREMVILRLRISLRDATIVERTQENRQLKQGTNDLEKELQVAKKTIEDLRRSSKRQSRRLNFLTERDAELQGQVDELDEELTGRLFGNPEGDIQGRTGPAGSYEQEHPQAQARDSLGGLENSVAELSLTNNALGRDLKGERRKVLDLRNTIARRDRMIEYLNQRIASYIVDDSDIERNDGSSGSFPTRPHAPDATGDGLTPCGPSKNSQVQHLGVSQ